VAKDNDEIEEFIAEGGTIHRIPFGAAVLDRETGKKRVVVWGYNGRCGFKSSVQSKIYSLAKWS
jgi:hypothetical protein